MQRQRLPCTARALNLDALSFQVLRGGSVSCRRIVSSYRCIGGAAVSAVMWPVSTDFCHAARLRFFGCIWCMRQLLMPMSVLVMPVALTPCKNDTTSTLGLSYIV